MRAVRAHLGSARRARGEASRLPEVQEPVLGGPEKDLELNPQLSGTVQMDGLYEALRPFRPESDS